MASTAAVSAVVAVIAVTVAAVAVYRSSLQDMHVHWHAEVMDE
jgi:hypothetical protein